MRSEIELAKANQNDGKIAGIEDRGECLLAVLDAEGVLDSRDAQSHLTALFSREGGAVTLATGHRAKGLEWDAVLHLDPWRLPSKHARRRADQGDLRPMEQELNLRYVIETRTKNVLVNADLEDFQ
jgi:superfamily I DNA/RNA helicase